MDDTSAVILRQRDQVQASPLLVNPPNDMELLTALPPGHIASLHWGHWQALSQHSGWTGQFGLEESLGNKSSHAIIWMPKARRELDLLFAWTQQQMHPGALLWLVGPKRGGIESGGKALKKALGTGTKRDSARHCQLWEYQVEIPQIGFDPATWLSTHSATVPLAGATTELVVADMPGVFSEGRLDEGTRMLLASIQKKPRSPVLDFACGAGVIGAALLKQWPALDLTMLDVQWQAVAATQRTLAENGLKAHVVAGDGLSGSEGRFGAIITNPPFHSGLETDLNVVRQFLVQAKAHLLPGGVLWLVANAFLPYRDLLEEQFPGVVVAAEDRRFRVYRAQAR